MKKSMVLIVVMTAFSLASCKKYHDCVCRTTVGTIETTSIKATKKKARNKCEAQSETVGNSEKVCKIED